MDSHNDDFLDIRVENFSPQSSDIYKYMYILYIFIIADPEKCALNIMYAQWVDG